MMILEAPSAMNIIESFIEGEDIDLSQLRVAILMMSTAYHDAAHGIVSIIDPRNPVPRQQAFDGLLRDTYRYMVAMDNELVIMPGNRRLTAANPGHSI